jgi:endoglucanase
VRFLKKAGLFVIVLTACGGDGRAKGTPLAPSPPDIPPMANMSLYVDPNSQAAIWVRANEGQRPQDAMLMRKISEQPMAVWLTNDGAPNVVREVLGRAGGAAVVFVAYNIPDRDCGSHSSGGAASYEGYRAWLASLVGQMRGSMLIWEPDALAHDCAGNERVAAAKIAVEFAAQNRIPLYLDAGHPNWHSSDEMAKRLAAAGVAGATGFSLNVSNFVETGRVVQYGREIVAILASRHNAPDKHFVVDTSRNGNGSFEGADAWCNPPGRALGEKPAMVSSGALDAFLWIKRPGESDGACRGGPSAGQFWPEYALLLAERAKW